MSFLSKTLRSNMSFVHTFAQRFSTFTAAKPLRVLVTGGANGIGRSIAETFASNNHHVASVDIDETANNELQSNYSNIVAINKDITETEAPHECIESMIHHFNGIDVLINNAAIQIGSGLALHEVDQNNWDQTIAVNLTSYFRFSKYAIQQILKQPKGDLYQTRYSIINIASVQGIQSEKGVSAYCATKGAILALTKNMAIEYAPLIRVNSISPGTILTPLVQRVCVEEFGQNLRGVAAKYPVRRMGNPLEVANLVYFLCNGQCGFLTGENIVIDGGILAQGGWAAKTDNVYVDEDYLKMYDE